MYVNCIYRRSLCCSYGTHSLGIVRHYCCHCRWSRVLQILHWISQPTFAPIDISGNTEIIKRESIELPLAWHYCPSSTASIAPFLVSERARSGDSNPVLQWTTSFYLYERLLKLHWPEITGTGPKELGVVVELLWTRCGGGKSTHHRWDNGDCAFVYSACGATSLEVWVCPSQSLQRYFRCSLISVHCRWPRGAAKLHPISVVRSKH